MMKLRDVAGRLQGNTRPIGPGIPTGARESLPFPGIHPASPAAPAGGSVVRWLVSFVVLGSVVAGTLSEVMLFRMFAPPDATAAFLGGAWVAMPFLVAAGMAPIVRRHRAALVTLLVTLLIVGGVGVSMLDAAATRHEVAREEAATAVLPGEDPDHGPAGMRKAGADMGVFVGGAFAIALVVVLPPAQLAGMVIPAGIAFGISTWTRSRVEARVSDGMPPEDSPAGVGRQ
jgi:hypothetical protein